MKQLFIPPLKHLVLLMGLLLSLPALAFESGGIYYDFQYEVDENGNTKYDDNWNPIITGLYVTSSQVDGGYTGDVVIPSTVEYEGRTYSVTSIGTSAFYNCTSLVLSLIHI